MGNRITDQSSRTQFFQLDQNTRNDNRQNPSPDKNQPQPTPQSVPQQATLEFEGNMRRFQLAQTLAVRNAAAVKNQPSTDGEYLPKKITFTPTELGAFAKKGKLPDKIVVDESYFEQKLFNSYGLDQFNAQDQAILQNIFGKDNPADAINWTTGGKPTQKFTAVLNAQGQYEINFELQTDTDKKLNQALFNKLFSPHQPMDLNLLKTLGVNAKSDNYGQTAESPDLTELALDLTQMGLDVVGIFEPTPFADLTNTGISAVRGNWGDAALSVIGVIPYVGDLAKLGKIPKWLKAIDKISNAVDKFGDIVRAGGKGKEAVEAFMKKAKDLLDKIPFDKLPDSLRDGFKSLKKKLDDFFASVKKTDKPAENINPMVKNGDEINDAAKTVPTTKTDDIVPTKQPEIEPPQKPNQPNSNKPQNTSPTAKTNPSDWNKNGMGLGAMVEQALKRKDLDAATLKSIDETLDGLHGALKNGKLENTNAMSDLISNLGKADPKKVSESLAELERANQILKTADLAPGTKVVIGAKEGQQLSRTTGLPDIDVAKVEADVYYKTKDGVLHLDEVKDTFNALTTKLDDSIKADAANPKQFNRYGEWVEKGNKTGEIRQATIKVRNSDPGFDTLLDKDRLKILSDTIGKNPAQTILEAGNRKFNMNDLNQMYQDAIKKLGELKKQNPSKSFVELSKEYFGSVEKAIQTLGKEYGTKI